MDSGTGEGNGKGYFVVEKWGCKINLHAPLEKKNNHVNCQFCSHHMSCLRSHDSTKAGHRSSYPINFSIDL